MDFNKHYFIESQLPEFIILIGLPGSGKSTWISKYNKNNKYIVVSPDDIRRELTGDVNDQQQNNKVWEIAKENTINSLKKGKSVILDATNTNIEYRKMFMGGLPPARLMAKVFEVDPEVSKERISKDIGDGKDRANVPPDIIDKMYDELNKSKDKLEDEGFEVIR